MTAANGETRDGSEPTQLPVLQMDDIEIAFARRQQAPLIVVSAFDLNIHAGAMHCIAGRSGSGKTSVLRVAAALAAPTRGQVRWHGRRVDTLSTDELADARRGRMSYVDQDATVIEQLTTIDNVLLPAIPEGIDRTIEMRAAKLLEQFGLHARARSAAAVLSGGERQRLALARALLLHPGFVAVDEPTASLDRASADTVIEALQVIARDGTAVLVASHDHGLIGAADSVTELD